MRVAAVDLGTNTTRLLVADVLDGRVDEVVRREEITRLGESVDERRILLPTDLLWRGTDHEAVAELARSIRDDQHAEVLQMQRWLARWFDADWGGMGMGMGMWFAHQAGDESDVTRACRQCRSRAAAKIGEPPA